MKTRSIDAHRARQLAVKADCDPRTIMKTLKEGDGHSIAAKRALQVLIEANLLPRPKAG